MEITAQMVRTLREKTGAGMMKCKQALQECNGDTEEAIDYLRKKGLASADGKAGRATSQGIICTKISPNEREAVVLELNCETDFVAKNEQFRKLADDLINAALASSEITTVEQLSQQKVDGQGIDEVRKAMVTKIGENITISRLGRLKLADGHHGTFDAYLHGEEQKVGVIVQMECENSDGAKHEDLKKLCHELALQVCAMKPRYIGRDNVPEETKTRENDILLGQLKEDPKNSTKPEEILKKIIDGRMDKFFKEFCLIEQVSVKDDTKTIQQMLDEMTRKLGGKVKVASFVRWGVGEAPATEQA